MTEFGEDAGDRAPLIVDASGMTISDLVASSDPALAQSIRQILSTVDEAAGTTVGWASYTD